MNNIMSYSLVLVGIIICIIITIYGKSIWSIWAKALGEKSGRTDRQADLVAFVRTIIVISYLITNGFIVAGVWRHW
jgi:hypothetical protein